MYRSRHEHWLSSPLGSAASIVGLARFWPQEKVFEHLPERTYRWQGSAYTKHCWLRVGRFVSTIPKGWSGSLKLPSKSPMISHALSNHNGPPIFKHEPGVRLRMPTERQTANERLNGHSVKHTRFSRGAQAIHT
jgi:hypothetical protein